MRGDIDDVYDDEEGRNDESEDETLDDDENGEEEVMEDTDDDDEDNENLSDGEDERDAEAQELHKELADLRNYATFVTQNLVSKSQRDNDKVIQDACWPKDRMMLTVRLERYLTHILELTVHKMLNAFADDDWDGMGKTLSATEASKLFDLFWGAMSKSWAIVYTFPECLKKPVEAVYKERGGKAYSASIWGDVIQFGIASCQAYEKKLEEEEKKIIREVILRAKAARKKELQERQAAKKRDNWWDDAEPEYEENEPEYEDGADDY